MLSDTQIRVAKPSAKTARLYDERGLYLEITTSGGRWWRLKYRFGGREKLLSMGTYPDTGLKAARDRRDRARELLAQGVDRSVARRAEKDSQAEAATIAFEAVARAWHVTVHGGQISVGHAARTLTRLEQHVFPWLGALPIGDIKPPQLLQVVRRIEARGATDGLYDFAALNCNGETHVHRWFFNGLLGLPRAGGVFGQFRELVAPRGLAVVREHRFLIGRHGNDLQFHR